MHDIFRMVIKYFDVEQFVLYERKSNNSNIGILKNIILVFFFCSFFI